MESKTILVVEDEMIIAMDLQSTLIGLGYHVPEIAISGEEAIAKALALRPDLVLMDIHLSDTMDGIDAAARINQDLDIPIIYLTAYADEETLKRASRTTPFGYILKPFEARELQANIEIAFYKSRIDKRIKENRQWLLAILSSICEGVAASDTDGLIQFMNPVAETLTGWSQNDAIGQSATEILQFIDEVTRTLIENPLLRSMQEDTVVYLQNDALLLDRKGREIPVADSAAPVRNEQGLVEGSVIVFRDITQQKQLQAALEYSALHDDLTQLPNRTLFLDRLQQAIERSRRSPEFGFAVMLLDLDRFKVINDTLGHLSGDRLLMAIAPRLRIHLRAIDTVARLGGDEFAILLEDVHNVAVACRTAERIINELRQPFHVNGHELLVTASIGIVLSSIPYENSDDLLRDADIAMYRAKRRKQGGYEVFDIEMHSQARTLMERERSLRQAIAQNELQVYYQPIVSLETERVTSLEALVRWQKPDEGLIYPDQFIPLAEDIGLITTIDQWVLREACRQLKAWQDTDRYSTGNPAYNWTPGNAALSNANMLSISVNLSAHHFTQPLLVETFESILADIGLHGKSIKLEVTESVLIENAEEAANVLSQLKQLDIQICLDDFGTGYSSLSYLHRFPIDIVKIDRSFIQGIDTDPEKLEIVRAIIGLCHTLNMTVTAEGIETRRQIDLLRDLRCECGQGYFFARPSDSTAIAQQLGLFSD